ncbi:hypothetical protein C7I87_09330 [Mesorhizobium sp. SARCC-RB16n]|uniref:hypothetical protein n=1 Tax=Mesorhizobium sp. SARCC-RB16n TaxID=2116687 RepID=UPI00122F1EF2|nr:hypothetical protein [Mesorhizobium sp. SARCC-RB16n]KAA3450923.1 hypothetical protein C7I87_09330 [Mesorhizobium sp. SARCC-RB16n]
MNDKKRPYALHTNRELAMMLAGTKPLAVFSHERVDGFEKSDALADQDFAPHIGDGMLSEHVRTFQIPLSQGATLDIDYWFYALKGEEWRVEAYSLLLDLLHRGAWCPQLEWQQGKLLGYTDEENLYHLSQTYPENPFVAQIGGPKAPESG